MTTSLNEDQVKLSADGEVELFQIHLNGGGVIYLTNYNEVTWRGDTYENVAIKIDGIQLSSDEEDSRPRLTVANPQGIFKPYVASGSLEKAKVKLYRVLREHVEANVNLFRVDSWVISQIPSVNSSTMMAMLRKSYDGPMFQCPYRMYLPPEFPGVRLS